MRRSGGFGNPLGFMMLSIISANMLLLIEVFLATMIFAYIASGGNVNWVANIVGFGVIAVSIIINGLISASLGSFIAAAVLHVCLLIFGGANAGYEATYRVHAYGHGSVYMLLAIPLIGPLFYVPMYFVVMIFGLMYAHQTEGWRASAAVLLPGVLFGCCLCPTMFALTGGLDAIANLMR